MRALPIYPDVPKLAIEAVLPRNNDKSCLRCSLGQNENVRSVCMPAELAGEGKDRVLIVSSGPLEADDRYGRPHMGATGAYLREQVSRVWPGEVVYDHAVRCAPGNRPLTDTMITACRPFAAQTFTEARPDRILCLGQSAVRAIFGRAFPPMSTRRGYAYTSTGIPVYFLIGPGEAARNRIIRAGFEDDLRWALTEAPPPQMDHSSVAYLIDREVDAQFAADELRDAGGITFDIETFGAAGNKEFQIINIAATPYGQNTAYVWEEASITNPALIKPFLDILKDPSISKAGHNLKFDCVGIQAFFGVRVEGRIEDTMLLWKLHDSTVEKPSLEHAQTQVGMAGAKDEAKIFVDLGAKELTKKAKDLETPPLRKTKEKPSLFHVSAEKMETAVRRVIAGDDPKRYSYAAIPPLVLTKYNALDTISAERVRSYNKARVDSQRQLARIHREVVQPLYAAVTQMEVNGFAASRNAVAHLRVAATADVEEQEKQVRAYGNFNPASPADVARLLFEQLKLGSKNQKMTAGGALSTDSAVLEEIDHPAAKAVLAYRQAHRLVAQYANGMEIFIRDDGRIHPSIRIAGTESGRPSCTEPNLMNIPRAGTRTGKMCRDVFVASRRKKIVEFDYSQIEIRVAAMLSQDDVMIGLLRSGVDYHLGTAKIIGPVFGVNPEEITKAHHLRDAAKTINFATLYGSGPKRIGAQLGISKAKAEIIQNAILGKFRKLKNWLEDQVRFARSTGYCQTWWAGEPARIRYLPNIASSFEDDRGTAERGSKNTPIQGTAADFTNASLGAIQRWIDREKIPAKLVLTVYDSIMLEVDDAAVDDVLANVHRIMTQWESMGVPLVAEAKVGESWGTLEGVKLH
jgi:uracil-DNA glycosylase family 4